MVLQQCSHLLSDPGNDDVDPKADYNVNQSFITKAKGALRDVWQESTTDVFDIGYDIIWHTKLPTYRSLALHRRRSSASTYYLRKSALYKVCDFSFSRY